MKDMVTETDIEYFKKYVNGNGGKVPYKMMKRSAIGLYFFFPVIGIILSYSDSINSLALRIVLIVIMVGGITSTIASDKLFSGNRGYLFVSWCGGVFLDIILFSIGIFLIYGISKILFWVFILIQIAVILLALVNIIKYISNRRTFNGSTKQGRYYGLGGCFGYFGGMILSHILGGVNSNLSSIIIAIVALAIASLLSVISVEGVFQLYYTFKYKIEIVNTWDAKT